VYIAELIEFLDTPYTARTSSYLSIKKCLSCLNCNVLSSVIIKLYPSVSQNLALKLEELLCTLKVLSYNLVPDTLLLK